MTANPITDRLMRHARPPSIRAALWGAFGSGLLTLAVTLVDTLQLDRPQMGRLTVALFAASLIMMALGPLIIAATSAALVARDAASEDFALVLLTHLSPRTIVWGYLAASLARMRVLLALIVGLMPAFVLGRLQVAAVFAVLYQDFTTACSPGMQGCTASLTVPPPEVIDGIIFPGTLAATLIALAFWTFCLLGAALGVYFGLRLPHPGAAAVISAATMLILMVMIGPLLFIMVLTRQSFVAVAQWIFGLAVLLLILFGLIWMALASAEPAVRHDGAEATWIYG